ncbi:hypothetical protein WICPIJ_004735 [Wickerhamomyces pijperi]|uniref:Uncharacterized protein n=1 Tax=Wickerhamomyces pijperi TaxID=599730 RepID=A0A9P8Q7A8_WICPI|nr:hypothetical protein WICPIJ_004735 [Wickerhamomyces pijperi]
MSVPRLIPPSTYTSILSSSFFSFKTGITSASTSTGALLKSNCLPPWFDNTTPCTPYSAALITSSLHWTPLMTIGNVVSDWMCFKSAQEKEGSMKEDKALDAPCVVSLSSSNSTPTSASKVIFMSRSLLPNEGASTVMKSPFMPLASACFTWVSVRALSELTYNWYHCDFCSPLITLPATISSKEQDAKVEIICVMFSFPAPLAMEISPSSCPNLANAVAEM